MIIQNSWRKNKAKKELGKRKRLKALHMEKEYYVRLVQARFRGKEGRKIYRQKLRER